MAVRRQAYRRNGLWKLDRIEEDITLTNPYDVLIKIHAISLNYRDANIINGTNPWSVQPNGIPCSDAAAEVIATGPHVTRFTVGDKVCPILDQDSINGRELTRTWLGGEVDGVLATHCIFNEEKLARIPDHLSYVEAACLPCAGLTAWNALGVGDTRIAGKTVLIQGTGGVSMMGLKLALQLGCKVILTSSSSTKLQKIHSEHPQIFTIDTRSTTGWDTEAKRLNSARGVDIVMENGGASTMSRSLNSVCRGGVISQIGYLGRRHKEDNEEATLSIDDILPTMIEKRITLRAINVGSRLDLEDLISVVDANKMQFTDVIDRVFPLEKAEEALRYLWSGAHTGKVIIEVP